MIIYIDNVYINNGPSEEWQHYIERQLRIIKRQGENIMAEVVEFEAVVTEMSDAITDIAGDIDELIAAQTPGGLSAVEADALLAKLRAVATRLRGVADVVPEEVPEEEA